jgi:predicted outer membrane repeat protein
MRALIIPILLWIAVLPAIASAIEVSGDVWGTWSPDTNPYDVVGELRVPPESTLVIEPGVFVNFQGHYKFIVDSLATLLAIGTETDSIIFTAEDPDSGWHGIRLRYADSSSQISYCHLEYGKAIGPSRDAAGGAIFCEYSGLTVSQNTFTQNYASRYGGAIDCDHSSVRITSNTISENKTGLYGGGIACNASNLEINGNTIHYNCADLGVGGGIHSAHCDLTMRGNTVSGNRAYWGSAGGILCRDGTLTISGNTITRNSGSYAGGIAITRCSGTIVDNFIDSNYARSCTDGYGGGLYCYSSDLMISNNIIRGNGSFYGGGLVCDECSPIIDHCLITGNGADSLGAAIYCVDASPIFVNNTISRNTSWRGLAGGIYSEASDLTIINTIIWGDSARAQPYEILLDSLSTLDITYSDIQGGWFGQGNINVDPLFRNPEAWDFHLMADYCGDPFNSPCIDVGHPDSLDVLLDCFHGLGSERCDMGAYGGRNSGWRTGINDDGDSNPIIPKQFLLHQNYPNPFNATTVIGYRLTSPTYVKLEIFNLFGQRLATLVDCKQQGGNRSVIWDAGGLASGIYFYRLTTRDYTVTRKMVLSK